MAFQRGGKEQKEVTLTKIRAQTALPKPKTILNAKDFTISVTVGSPLVTEHLSMFSTRFSFSLILYSRFMGVIDSWTPRQMPGQRPRAGRQSPALSLGVGLSQEARMPRGTVSSRVHCVPECELLYCPYLVEFLHQPCSFHF